MALRGEMIQTNFKIAPTRRMAEPWCLSSSMCLNIFMLTEYGGWDKEAALLKG